MIQVDPSSMVDELFGGVQIVNKLLLQPGTLGAVFPSSGWTITAAHVLMGRNFGVKTGEIQQPGISSESHRLSDVKDLIVKNTLLDYALFVTDLSIAINSVQSINGIKGTLNYYASPQTDMKVKKFGSTTKETKGVVVSGSDNRGRFLIESVGVAEFSKKGDSGSLVILDDDSEELTVVGMNIEVSERSVALDFRLIFDDLLNNHGIRLPLEEKTNLNHILS